MVAKDSCFCVILAGGKGHRLWPCSRNKEPKQFVDFFGTGRTQLQQTFDRFKEIVPVGNIFVSTNVDYAHFVREQLPELEEGRLLADPVNRNTAPSVAWVLHRIMSLRDDACLIIAPSDHAVVDAERFRNDVERGFDYVSQHDTLLTIGVEPTRPETGYGYLQMGEEMADDVYKVKSFTEKPEREFASLFTESGEFCWNTGIYLANGRHLRGYFQTILPPIFTRFDEENASFSFEQEAALVERYFPSYPNLSIDYAFLEMSHDVHVMRCGFGWADLGTWHSIYEMEKKGEGDNVLIDSDAIMNNCRGNIVKVSKGKLAVINGLEDYIVAEKGNVLLICKKEDSPTLIRKYINEVQMKKGEEYV